MRAYGANRFIPACARNAREGAPSAKNGSVHPRIRGERAGPGSDRTKPVGSSPHARGTRQGLTREPGRHRFILACAGNACAGRPRLPQSAVHPRMCGECLPAASTTSILIGSSPHVRGTPPGYRLPAAQRRSIPACAGNALDGISRKAVNTVHPRMRGERSRKTGERAPVGGSSPHARGTRQADHLNRIVQRFIPAYAGNATTLHRPHFWNSVHPRIRGERKTSDLCKQHPDGSSPHTRGTLRGGDRMRGHTRFIPAYAGNAQSPGRTIEGLPVHPRIRRERIVASARNLKPNGSSPHTRGTPRQPAARGRETRFIPAYAGNATRSSLSPLNISVHPRIRGERPSTSSLGSRNAGSSPHARGTRSVFKTVLHRDRFIPACAGNANWRFRARCVGTVHPRMRGERGKCSRCPHVQRGSSPHARGTHLNGTHNPEKLRFIPACAGNAARADGRPGLVSVHPRMRGERWTPPLLMPPSVGSSPHARGTHVQGFALWLLSRFIPACAGNALPISY